MTGPPIHPQARHHVARIGLPEPLLHYRPAFTERLFTHPFAGPAARYPDPVHREVRELYARVLSRELEGPPVSADTIAFTPGSASALELLVRAFCEPGVDRICIQSPTFPAYTRYAAVAGVDLVDVPLRGALLDDLDVAGIVASRAKLTFLCHPGNPTSVALRPEQLEAVLAGSSGLVVIDEAYIELSGLRSAVGLLGRWPNLVVVRTFSKAWGLAGCRVGAALAEPSILQAIRVLQDPFAVSAPGLAAVREALLRPEEVAAAVGRLVRERQRVSAALEALPSVSRVWPSSTNFLCARIAGSRALALAFLAEGVLATDVSRQIPGSLKISIGSEPDNDRMLALVAAHRGESDPDHCA